VCEAVNTISDVAQGRSATMNDNGNQIYDGPGELAAALDDFDVIMYYLIHNIFRRNILIKCHYIFIFIKMIANGHNFVPYFLSIVPIKLINR